MRLTLLASTLALVARPVAASLAFCATENTGSSFSAGTWDSKRSVFALVFIFTNETLVTDTYQSNGACEDTCADYALGVLQGKKCWCSNVAPSTDSRESVSDCDTGCPGYPADSCGSAAKGVWAYVKISGNSISSTESNSGTTSSSTTTTSSASTTDPSTTNNVVKETTNASGQVRTVTVAAAVSTSGLDTSDKSTDGGSSLSGGSIAGIVIGVLGGIALVGALIFMIFFYRKRARSASPIPSQDMADRTSQGSSFIRGVFPQGHTQEMSGSSSLGRKHTFTDNRMKADIYPNGPRDSSVSLQDNEDYSRPVLRVTNAD
ncbi:Carbohydrate-binding WSC subgroup [Penicillium atrosanguineum]|uniref:Carbohydrate-binding WSC subgroup n=1 Tax=Penicillium atrosanguineum TaxID=1132637 RepID=A0A9W9Q2W6_9EURO|nr:Carbohydrate-binding WSC subgroup [Penicillium atrosanguineum]KAJ5323608.1 Carbohydrate-binding WSC subgroup [Penicillium atrosanguineum]